MTYITRLKKKFLFLEVIIILVIPRKRLLCDSTSQPYLKMNRLWAVWLQLVSRSNYRHCYRAIVSLTWKESKYLAFPVSYN